MSINVNDKNLGHATAYAYYKAGGGTMTEAEFTEFMADFGTASQTAVEAAQAALASKNAAQTAATTATNKASEAASAATTATNKAAEAQADADAAALDASQAMSAASTATTKATEATTAAATATSAKTDAVAANTAAQSAKTAAQTAQTGAETAAASVSASAAQIATNTEDIESLKSEFTALESDGVVPSAEQILTDKGVTDSVPYHYRKTGGDGADRLYDQIVGGTVCWNQWVQNGDFADGSNGWDAYNSNNVEASVENGVLTARFLNNSNNGGYQYGVYTTYRNSNNTPRMPIAGHVYVIIAEVKATATGMYGVDTNGTSAGKFSNVTDANVWTSLCKLFVAQNNNAASMIILPSTRITTDDTMQIRNVMFIDLTAMFGSTIADYIYQLEQTTAGAGLASFKSLFPNDYYEYNAGELLSVSGLSEHKMVGFNQWDEEWENGTINVTSGANVNGSSNIRSKGFIPVVPNKQYHVTIPASGNMTVVYYDATKHAIRSQNIYKINQGGNFDSLDSVFVRFFMENTYGTTYNHDICINLSDPAKNGTYEPYKAHSYPLDSTVELRGIPKIVDGKVCFDGDVYEYTGKVTRNTILRAYQSGDESLANAITDGTNTVVYSANASTEQADPYQHLQQCDPNGTEEYVSTGIVPIGHNSFYPENLKSKIEGLPWNFASLIAPTESTFTVTRNYTTGSLFIVDNVLYKATANIANGGTITPNTNCTATTLAEIISALA